MKILMFYLFIVAFATQSVANTNVIHRHFSSLVPIQRAMLLQEIGVPFNELPEAILLSLLNDSPINNTVVAGTAFGTKVFGTRVFETKIFETKVIDGKVDGKFLANYMPSLYNLSAEDVLVSLKNYRSDAPLLHEISKRIIFLFGHSDSRDILGNLNKFDFKAIEELLHKVSAAWSLWMQQTAFSFEATEPLGIIFHGHERALKGSVRAHVRISKLLDVDDLIPRAKEMAREWKKIEAMPPSHERNRAVSVLYANNFFNTRKSGMTRDYIDKEVQKLNKIGLALLDDLTPGTIFAVGSLSLMLISNTTVDIDVPIELDSRDEAFLLRNLLNLLDEELQKLLANKG